MADDKVMQAARLENWRLVYAGFDGYVLMGNVYGHPRLTDSHNIMTSLVPSLTGREPEDIKLKEGDTILTLNTAYTLGKEYDESAKEDESNGGL